MRVHMDVVSGRHAPQVIVVDATSVDEARLQATQRGYTVLRIRQAAIDWRQILFFTRAGRPALDVAIFIEQLRDLLAAGLSVIEALDTLCQTASPAARPVMAAMASRLRAGRRLSEALGAEPAFPGLLVALVRAAELTSDLPSALSRFLEHEARVSELRHRVVSVAIYPALVALVGAGVLAFLMLYVMPRFARVFDGMGGELPWAARAMVWWSHWLSAHGPWLAVAGAMLAGAAAWAVLSPAGRMFTTRRLLAVPALSERLRIYFLARWYRATGMLVEGGIPLAEALPLARSLLPAALRPSGLAVERHVRDGLGPAAAHVAAGMTSPVAGQLLHAGERTGDLGAVLTRIAHFHEAETGRALERGMRAIEPVLMVAIGLGVGIVVVLMYLPIFELAAAIQ